MLGLAGAGQRTINNGQLGVGAAFRVKVLSPIPQPYPGTPTSSLGMSAGSISTGSPTPSQFSRDDLFENHDVLALIFSYFIPSFGNWATEPEQECVERAGNRQQLLKLALVCHAFSRPALDCLWNDIDDIASLLKLHPGLTVVENKYHFIGNSDSHSRSRFSDYAKRIRTLRFKDLDGAQAPIVSLAGLSCLTQQLKGAPLTPGLQTLYFVSPSCDSAHMGLLPLILSPSVESVIFDGSFIHADIYRVFALPQLCLMVPNLRSLQVCDDSDTSAGTPTSSWESLPDLLGRLRLSSLRLAVPSNITLTPTALATLGKGLENLIDLTLDCHTPSHGPSTDVLGTTPFPALKTLHLYNRSGSEICHCYPSFLVSRVTRITFCTGDILDVSAFSRTAESLSKARSLKAIEIKTGGSVVHASFIPLLQHPSLEELILDPNSHFADWTEEEIQLGADLHDLIDAAYTMDRGGEGGRAALRVLSTPVWWDSHKYPPLSTLVYIAQNANGLEEITLSIDSSVVDVDGPQRVVTTKSLVGSWNSTQPSSDNSESTLQYLTIADHRPSKKIFTAAEYRDIACLLDTIFPNLVTVKPIQRVKNFDNRWDQDWELIEDYRKMRKALRVYRGMH